MSVTGHYFPLSEAAGHIPGRPHLTTLTRWALKGVRGVKLASIVVGRRRFVTQASIDLFLAELNKSDAERLSKEGC